jgi:hypothetical protein
MHLYPRQRNNERSKASSAATLVHIGGAQSLLPILMARGGDEPDGGVDRLRLQAAAHPAYCWQQVTVEQGGEQVGETIILLYRLRPEE